MTLAFRSLRVPEYRWFLVSTLASSMGYQSQQVAMGWLAYDITRSPLALGLVLISWGIPAVVCSLLGGVLADTRNRRQIMTIMTLISAVASLGIAISLTTHHIALWHLLVSGVLSGVAISINMPSRQAFLFDISGPENITDAVAVSSAGMNAMRLVSPAISGFLIGAVGVDVVYYLITLYYLVSAVTLVVPLKGVVEAARVSSEAIKELVSGLRYLRDDKNILWLITVSLVTMFIGLPFSNLMPAFAAESLHQGPEGYGLLMSMVGLGAIIGSVGTIFLGSLPWRRVLLMVTVFAWGTGLIAFSISTSMAAGIPLAVLLGLSSTGASSMNNVLVQSEVDDAHRGRVSSFFMLSFSISLVGTLPTSGLAQGIGTAMALGYTGLGLVLISVPLTIWGRSVVSARRRQHIGV